MLLLGMLPVSRIAREGEAELSSLARTGSQLKNKYFFSPAAYQLTAVTLWMLHAPVCYFIQKDVLFVQFFCMAVLLRCSAWLFLYV